MSIEFREIRWGEIDEVVTFAAAQGAAVERDTLCHTLSLQARNSGGETLGVALHHVDDAGCRHVAVCCGGAVHIGLNRLLLDRALRKAEADGHAITHVSLGGDADEPTWSGADWLARLRTVSPPPAA
ncbi:MAG: hypothetical protein AAFX76_10720 [Planctomycetota bacterium]